MNKTVQQVKPDVIINAAAYTAVDKAETEQELAYAVNLYGSENLAKSGKEQDIPLLHISTDYVYDGEKQSPYLGTDQPQTIENRQSLKVACIEEISYEMGYITKGQLIEVAQPLKKNQYDQYLLRRVEEEGGGV